MNKNSAYRALYATGSSIAKSYIDECEHQDGDEYWSEFETAQELVDDFQLYRRNVSEEDKVNDGAKENFKNVAHMHYRRATERCLELIAEGVSEDRATLDDEELSNIVKLACRDTIGRSEPLHDDDAIYYALCDKIVVSAWRRAKSLILAIEVK